MLVAIVVTIFAGPDARAAQEEAEVKDLYKRQLLLVFNPVQTPIKANQLVARQLDESSDVRVLRDLLGATAGISKVLQDDLPSASAIKAGEASPIEVEDLLNNYLVLTYESEAAADLALERLSKESSVLNVSRNIRYELSSPYYLEKNPAHPNDGTHQWGMGSLSVSNFPLAWAKLRGFAQLGAVDTGIYWVDTLLKTHDDLSSNFRSHFSRAAVAGQEQWGVGQFLALSQNFGESGPDRGHGTHVSGLMAANPPPPATTTGMRGACPNCSFAMMKFDATPDESVGSQLIVELIRSGVQVINLSWGAIANDPNGARPPSYCTSNPNQLICLALSLAATRQVVVVAASGNRKTAIQFPANQASVIAVGGLEFIAGTSTTAFWTSGYGSGSACPQPSTSPRY